MNKGQRQVVAEKIASTVRVLELLGLEYEVSNAKVKRRGKGNKSPRVIHVNVGKASANRVYVYNSFDGHTWANQSNGKPIPHVKSIEDLFNYLSKLRQ